VPTLKETLSESIKDAMRAKDSVRLGALRLISAAVKQVEVDERCEVDDLRMMAILDKMQKQRRESIAQFEVAKRTDLIAQEQIELDIIQAFLPTPLTEVELSTLVADAIATSGASSAKDMGRVMAILKPMIQGRADGAWVSAQVKAALSA